MSIFKVGDTAILCNCGDKMLNGTQVVVIAPLGFYTLIPSYEECCYVYGVS